MHTLEVRKLTKQIKHTTVLNDISFSLKGGTIYGFIGDNGSGKTMLFRAVSGLIRISGGSICYDGKIERSSDIGITIENNSLFPDLSGYDNLRMLAGIRKIIGREEIRDILLRVGLNPDDKKIVKKYSLGMKQRLVLAQAIMEKPAYLLLDEPTNGIDKDGVSLIKNIIAEEKKRGAVIMLASHIESDMKSLCDEKFYMDSGRIYRHETGVKTC